MAVWNFSKNSSDLVAGPFLKQLTSILTSPTPWHIPLYLSLSGEPFLPSSSCTADHLKVETLKWYEHLKILLQVLENCQHLQSNKIIKKIEHIAIEWSVFGLFLVISEVGIPDNIAKSVILKI